MAAAYKLIFDLSLYYSLSGFYATLLYGSPPSVIGFVLLCGGIILERAFRQRRKHSPILRFVLMALPAAALLSGPPAAAVVQLIPGWVYVLYCVKTGRTGITHNRFQERFRFSLPLLAAVLPGFVISRNAASALETVTPYITLMLICGVFLLRILRKNATDDLKQLFPLAAVAALCALLTAAQVPQLLGAAFTWLYEKVLIWIFEGMILLFCQVLNVLYIVLKWILGLFGRDLSNPLQPEPNGDSEDTSSQNAIFSGKMEGNAVVQLLFSVASVILLIWAVIGLFRRLRGYQMPVTRKAAYLDQRQSIAAFSQPRMGLLRPREPRLAVRFYYAKFLQECRRRGMVVKSGCTSEELVLLSADYFPGADPGDLRELYTTARYCQTGPVSPAQADRAAACWRSLKKTKLQEYGK